MLYLKELPPIRRYTLFVFFFIFYLYISCLVVLSLVSSWFGFLAVPSAEKRCAYTSVPHPSWYPSSGEFRLLLIRALFSAVTGGRTGTPPFCHTRIVLALIGCPLGRMEQEELEVLGFAAWLAWPPLTAGVGDDRELPPPPLPSCRRGSVRLLKCGLLPVELPSCF